MKKMITRRQFMAAAGVVAAASALTACGGAFPNTAPLIHCCRFYRWFRCCFRQHHQGGCDGPPDR